MTDAVPLSDTEIDARQASAIASGMKAVALSDGEPHPRELALIDAFTAELPDAIDPTGVTFATAGERAALLRSLYLVALVDGALKEPEIDTIREIARAHGATDAELEDAVWYARRELLGRLRGVHVFRDQAMEVADELGVLREEAEEILAGHLIDR